MEGRRNCKASVCSFRFRASETSLELRGFEPLQASDTVMLRSLCEAQAPIGSNCGFQLWLKVDTERFFSSLEILQPKL